MRAVAIIQARMGSSRLPGKVLQTIRGKPLLWHVVDRVVQVEKISEVVVATSDLPIDRAIVEFCDLSQIPFFAGSESDVLDRFYQAAKAYQADPILRITGDCPFVDPELISDLLELYADGCYDHVGVATGAGAAFLEGGRYPDGLDCECFNWQTLEQVWSDAVLPSDREHVTPFIWRVPGRFRVGSLKASQDYGHLRWTVDDSADLAMVRWIYEALYPKRRYFLMEDVLNLLSEHPEISELNRSSVGKEGYRALWLSAGEEEIWAEKNNK